MAKLREEFQHRGPAAAVPGLLTLGSIAWRITSAASTVEFLSSLRGEKVTLMFTFLLAYGWWILALVGLVWLALIRSPNGPYRPGWDMVSVVGILAFMFGMLVAVRSSGIVPNVLAAWGPTLDGCGATIDASKLQIFKDDYKLLLVCGKMDVAVDRMEDDRIAVSSAFTIIPGGIAIEAKSLLSGYKSNRINWLPESTKSLSESGA